ncbi:MAG: gamma-glutamyl-gamma-aminobutyrate hydrolase family protein [Deltaproteobacteria bacterium]|nr:gamma-glutamyl-gamma-aminobutyrate hydrolase family protein [Deltaproteobacteria bacterium]
MPEVLAIQHIDCETLGTIADALRAEGLSTQLIQTFKDQPVPGEIGEALGLIVMGGPMAVYEQDRFPFLRQEIRLIENALQEEKPILGVCLGSQLLAAALGAKVTKGRKKEIGWYPISLTDAAMTDPLWSGMQSPFVAYHWHGDIFELPRAAFSLASSDLTRCQAFRCGDHAYGFLFHMEVTEKIIGQMVETFTDELIEEDIDGDEIVRQEKDYLPSLQRIGEQVFGRWASLVKGRR